MMTCSPCARSNSTVTLPIYPAPPVTRTAMSSLPFCSMRWRAAFALFAGLVLNLFDQAALGALFCRAHRRGAAPPQHEHHQAEEQHDDTPPKVNVDAERAGVHGFVADQPIDGENHAEDGKHQADWQPYVESHLIRSLPEDDV